MKKVRMAILSTALTPTRCQLGFASGNRAKRAGTGLVPMCCFQASGLPARLRLELKPTPSDLLVGGSAIIVVIRLPPRARIRSAEAIQRRGNRSLEIRTCELPVREYLVGMDPRIGLSY